MKITVYKDFSEFPGLRHCSISDNSGEEFYHKILNKEFAEAIQKNEKVTVDLDLTAGYAPSFLDEAFGNLVYDFSKEVVESNLEIISIQEPSWISMILKQTYVEWEERRSENEEPKKTKKHQPWYRMIDSNLEKRVWIS